MPVYEYRCTECEVRSEHLLPVGHADTVRTCDECGGDVRRLWSRVGVKLQGWGFSRNDGMVPDRPGRGDFREVAERAERLADGGQS